MDSTTVRSTPLADTSAAASLGANGQAASTSPSDRAKVLELAQEFESYFVLQMIRQMRSSMLDEESKDGLGAETMTDTLDGELARQLTKGGGIGLTSMLRTSMERQIIGTSSAASSSAASSAVVPIATTASATLLPTYTAESGALSATAVPLPLDAPVSSPYGYRNDPFSGVRRFHAGVDIAAAYGKEVPSAGNGRVVEAGEEGGYGNTVVIEHEGGVRTRYAHLSSVDVKVGESVGAGTVVGRVGSSGRSTGPHLHFEVLQDGRPVNPAVAATKYAGLLKIGGVVADLPSSQPSGLGVAVGVDDEDSGQ